MIIDNENLVILVEVLKTGTTFIRKSLKSIPRDNGDGLYISNIISDFSKKHAPLSKILTDPMLKYRPENYDVYIFIRHPEDFFVSEFFEYKDHHLMRYFDNTLFENHSPEMRKLHRKNVYNRYKFFKKEDAFDLNKNLNAILCDDSYQHFPKCFVNIKSIYNHYLDADVLEDKLHICKYEDFKDSIEKFFRSIKKPIPNIEMKINVSKKDQKINRENRMLINEIFDGDFKKYNYYKRNMYSCES